MICRFHDQGTYFFDYGNSFLKAVFDAGVRDVCTQRGERPGRIRIPLLCGGHPGPVPVRLRLWALPLVLPVRESPRTWTRPTPRRPSTSWHTTGGIRTTTTMCGCGTPRRNTHGGGHPVPHPVSGRHGPHEHRAEVQRDGAQRRDRPRDAGPGPPRHRGNRLPLPGDLQHQGRLQYHGGHGHPVLRRKRRPGHEPDRPAQRRRRGRGQGHQRRLRHGAGRLRAGGHHPAA